MNERLAALVAIFCFLLGAAAFVVVVFTAPPADPAAEGGAAFELPATAVRVSATVWRDEDGNKSYVVHFANRTAAMENYQRSSAKNTPKAGAGKVQKVGTDGADGCCDILPLTVSPDTVFNVVVAQAPSAGWLATLEAAIDAWRPYGPTTMGTVTSSFLPVSLVLDGVNYMTFGTITIIESSSIIAVTVLYHPGGTEVVEWDQRYNSDVKDFDGPDSFDLYTIALHEMGHVNLLGDLYSDWCQGVLMDGTVAHGETRTIDDATKMCLGLDADFTPKKSGAGSEYPKGPEVYFGAFLAFCVLLV